MREPKHATPPAASLHHATHAPFSYNSLLHGNARMAADLPTAHELRPDHPDRARHVARAAAALAGREPADVIDWAAATFADRLGVTTGLGYSGVVLLDLLLRRLPSVEACFIDTGCHFDETIDLLRRLERWGGGRLRFNVLRTALTDEQIRARAGAPPWRADPDLCCRLRKVEPMERVVATRDAWCSALRRDQGPSRTSLAPVRLDARGVLRIHPLAAWSAERCWAHIRARSLPYNPLHDCGYPSVGCIHCTVPVHTGEHERTGRWASTPKTECGLHTT